MQTDITKGGCNRRHAVGFGPPDGAGPQGPSRASQRGTTPQHDTSRATVCVALRSGRECPQTPQAPYGRAEHQAGTDTKKGTGHERERGRTTDGVSAEPEGRPAFHRCLASRDRRYMVRQVDITTPRLLTAAGAVVREFVPPDRMEQLLTALEKAFAAVPISGFAAVVNVPTRLAFVAVWSWALGAGKLGPAAARCRSFPSR